jgi:hypothetical protein
MTPKPNPHFRRPQTRYTWYWIVWAILSGGGFTVLEAQAVRSGQVGNTLSVHWRRLFGIHPERPWSPVTKMMICGLLQWLIIHIIVEGKEERNARIRDIVQEELED